MKFEVVVSYRHGMSSPYRIDKELSTPAREVSDIEAESYMALAEGMGFTRHETASQVFYSKQTDCNHVSEYIFWKK